MSHRSLANRVAKLSQTIVQRALKKPTIDVSSWPSEKIQEALDAAIDERDWDITNRIADFVDKLDATPWHNATTGEKYLDAEGKEQPTPHFFDYWLWGLAAGSWHLPRKIPREWWEGFDDLYGAVLFRCEDCLTGLGNARRYEACPVCRSRKLSVKKLSGPPWDAKWEYTPMPRR